MKSLLKRLVSVLASSMIIFSMASSFPVSAADQTLTLHGRNIGGAITEESTSTVIVTDATAPACEFEYEGYEFWGWSTIADSAVVTYKTGDYIPSSVDTLYASWYIPCGYEIGDITPDGGLVVDKYMSFYTGSDTYYSYNNQYRTFDGVNFFGS